MYLKIMWDTRLIYMMETHCLSIHVHKDFVLTRVVMCESIKYVLIKKMEISQTHLLVTCILIILGYDKM